MKIMLVSLVFIVLGHVPRVRRLSYLLVSRMSLAGKRVNDKDVKEMGLRSVASEGDSGPGVNQFDPIQVYDLEDYNFVSNLLGMGSKVKLESPSKYVT